MDMKTLAEDFKNAAKQRAAERGSSGLIE